MKTKIIIENGNEGSDNCKINVSGIEIKNPVLLSKDFKMGDGIIGLCNVVKENGVLYAVIDSDILLREDIANLYPSVGIKVCDKDNGTISKSLLALVGLCKSKNRDESIKNIKDQLIQ